jgi:hypothetical protein
VIYLLISISRHGLQTKHAFSEFASPSKKHPACLFRWFIVAESIVRWFIMREKHCWMTADLAE